MMRKFRITGIDRDSGFETSVIVDAVDENDAEIKAVKRGIAVRHCEEVVPDHAGHAAFRMGAAVAALGAATGWSRRRRSDAHDDGAESEPPSPEVPPPPQPPPPSDPQIPPPYIPAFTMPPEIYWSKMRWAVANGVLGGLIIWSILAVGLWIVLAVIGAAARG